jgi:hypothetical protein
MSFQGCDRDPPAATTKCNAFQFQSLRLDLPTCASPGSSHNLASAHACPTTSIRNIPRPSESYPPQPNDYDFCSEYTGDKQHGGWEPDTDSQSPALSALSTRTNTPSTARTSLSASTNAASPKIIYDSETLVHLDPIPVCRPPCQPQEAPLPLDFAHLSLYHATNDVATGGLRMCSRKRCLAYCVGRRMSKCCAHQRLIGREICPICNYQFLDKYGCSYCSSDA